MQPIFLLSLPRSGSTLTQHLLATNGEIATTAEAWILLPVLYALRAEGATAEYNHQTAARTINYFCESLPNGRGDYLSAVRQFALALYCKAAPGNQRYFLDKTPRYHFVVDVLFEAFPEGKFIFLWRNPLAVAASYLNSWSRSGFSVNRFRKELVGGFERLTRAYEHHAYRSTSVRYEDIVSDPAGSQKRLFEYLELDWSPELLDRLPHSNIPTWAGDHLNGDKRTRILSDSINKWRQRFTNPYVNRWGQDFLKTVGAHQLSHMGYSLDDLLRQLASVRPSVMQVCRDGIGSSIDGTLRLARSSAALRALERRVRGQED